MEMEDKRRKWANAIAKEMWVHDGRPDDRFSYVLDANELDKKYIEKLCGITFEFNGKNAKWRRI